MNLNFSNTLYSLVLFFLFVSFYEPKFKKLNNTILSNNEHTVSCEENPSFKNLVFLKNDFNGFKELLAFKESGGRYFCTNKYGFMGKYQFNLSTLKMFNVRNAKLFLNSPELQEKVFLLNVQRNKWILRKDIKWFAGSFINGSKITESGILAAAHLAGPGNVKKYLRGGGKDNSKDILGTSISYYMDYFRNYDLSFVKKIKNPKVYSD